MLDIDVCISMTRRLHCTYLYKLGVDRLDAGLTYYPYLILLKILGGFKLN